MLQTKGRPAAAAKSLQSCPTLCHPIDGTPPGSSVSGILQARILEWVAFPFSRWSSQSRDQTQVSHIAGVFFTSWATREALCGVHSPCYEHWIVSSCIHLCLQLNWYQITIMKLKLIGFLHLRILDIFRTLVFKGSLHCSNLRNTV